MRASPFLAIALLAACDPEGAKPPEDDTPVDADGDGSPVGEDCDDAVAEAFPGNPEVCDGIDNDCNDAVDDQAADARTWYADADADGHGDPAQAQLACEAPAETARVGDDCDDTDPGAFPAAPETCGDGVDQDCDATPDQGCSLVGATAVDRAFATIDAANGGAWAGSPIETADLDGDGVTDLILGSPEKSRVEVLWGPLSPGAWSASSTGNDVDGESCAGKSVAAADLDGNGTVDLAVGATCTSVMSDGTGHAYLLAGPSARADRTVDEAWASVRGNDGATYLGTGLDAGDVDGDGDADLVVGAANDERIGRFGVRLGPVAPGEAELDELDAVFAGEQDNDYAGYAPVVAGDTDGDGFADLLAGGWGYEGDGDGRAWLVRGPVDPGTWPLAEAATILRGESTGSAGYAVAGVGDVNDDGYDDVSVGAYAWRSSSSSSYAGRAYVLSGPLASGTVELSSAATIVSGFGDGDKCGMAMAGGDLDADGASDLAVGCPDAGDVGVVAVLYGPVATGSVWYSQADATVAGEGADFGASLAIVPDVTGDGLLDLVAGAPYYDDSAGRVYVFAGGTR